MYTCVYAHNTFPPLLAHSLLWSSPSYAHSRSFVSLKSALRIRSKFHAIRSSITRLPLQGEENAEASCDSTQQLSSRLNNHGPLLEQCLRMFLPSCILFSYHYESSTVSLLFPCDRLMGIYCDCFEILNVWKVCMQIFATCTKC